MSSVAPDLSPDPAAIETARATVPITSNHDRAGNWTAKNTGAVTHALYAAELPAEFQHLQREIDTFLAGAVADDGGDTEITTRRRALLQYRARLHRRIVQLDAALELRGLADKRGKLRVAWLSQLSTLIASAARIDSLLGLDRRERRVPSLAEFLNQRPLDAPPETVTTADAPTVASATPSETV